MRRPVLAAAVTVVALTVGGGTAWAVDARADAAAAGRDRIASAVDAGRRDEHAASRLADRSAGLVSLDLLDDSRQALESLLPAAQSALDESSGEVADETVRDTLASAIDAARASVAGSAAPATAAALADELTTATAAVTTAHDEWLAAKAAEEAAAALAVGATAQLMAGVPAPGPPPEGCSVPAQPPFYTSVPREDGNGSNGGLPRSAMAELSWATDSQGNGFWLVTEAAEALERLNAEFFAAFGRNLDLDLTYRDYCTQVAMGEYYGYPRAARPGTSNHGWGKAIDVPEWRDQYGYGTELHTWLAENGPRFGWYEQPPGGEYWHFDYRG